MGSGTMCISSSNVTKDVIKGVVKELSEGQKVILDLVAANSFVTTTEMSQKTGVVIRTIKRDIEKLQASGILTRKGGRKDGEWVLTDLDKSVFDKLTKLDSFYAD